MDEIDDEHGKGAKRRDERVSMLRKQSTRSRKPKPTHLHVVDGTFNVTHRGKGRRNEPKLRH